MSKITFPRIKYQTVKKKIPFAFVKDDIHTGYTYKPFINHFIYEEQRNYILLHTSLFCKGQNSNNSDSPHDILTTV